MPEYLSPGVYVEEISPGSRPIEGVSTSTAGFVGQTERGPTIPRLVTSWLDFQRWFGGHTGPGLSFLPYSIQGFFDNGGQRAFIARVTAAAARPSTLDLVADGVRITALVPASATVLTGAAGVDFLASGVVAGDIVRNVTDGSEGTVTGVTATTVTVNPLAGGTNNVFAAGDAYVIASQIRVAGAAAAPVSPTVLTGAAGVDFLASGVVAGDIVRNVTDGSQGTVTGVTTTTVTVGALAGGTNNAFAAGNVYVIVNQLRVAGVAAPNPTVLTGAAGVNFLASGVVAGDIVRNVTDGSQGTVTGVTATTVTVDALSGGTANGFNNGDAYAISSSTAQIRVAGVAGAAAAPASATVLTGAAGVDFLASGVVAGDIVRNVTDGSEGTVTGVTATTVTVNPLAGGTNNVFAAGDAYVIASQIRVAGAAAAPVSPTVLTGAAGVDFLASGVVAGDIVRNVTDGSQGTVTGVTTTTVTVGALAGGTNNAFAAGNVYVIVNQLRVAGVAGAAAAPASPTVLTGAAGVDFLASGVVAGDIVRNITDNSRGRVTAVASTTVTVDLLTGGTDNSFAANDRYIITRGRYLHAEAIGRGAWGNRLFLWPRGSSRSGFRLTILYYLTPPPVPLVDPTNPNNITNPNRREPTILEDFDNLGVDPTGPNYVLTTVNGASQLIHLDWTDAAQPLERPQNARFAQMGNGTDGATRPTATDYIGRNGTVPTSQREGLAGLEVIDEISLLCVPDHVHPSIPRDAQNLLMGEIVNQCERLKDRFGVLHVEAAQGNVATIQPPRDTSYAAIYYPWIRMFDPPTQDTILVPPGGHVTGIYARTDIERGVHKAPANENVRGIITIDLNSNRGPLEFKVTKGQHDLLNPRGINVIRDFRADRRGIRVWGARTLSSDPQWKYVNVRRLFLFVEESIDEGTQWVVFEPNDEPTWAKVRRSITNFLISVWRSGALMGATQDEAFFVKCDRTTMTQDDIDNGRLICYIGIAPVKPAEFVIFRISQKTMEAAA